MQSASYGFRIVGACYESRRLVDATAAFQGYADCDMRAEVDREGYLSAFQFPQEFAERNDGWRVATKGYDGPCWSPWLWFDIDRPDDIDAATTDARRLCAALVEQYGLEGDELLIFFSGSKGFHVGLPASLWRAPVSDSFNRIAKRMAEQLAESIDIDMGVYDKVRAFRAPNSRHAKTGLHKRIVEFDELFNTTAESIVMRAAQPLAFEVPTWPAKHSAAVADWQQATEAVAAQEQAIVSRWLSGVASLTGATRELIESSDQIEIGDRHRRLFSAAANLAEFNCPAELAFALLTEPGRDMGLPPTDVRRQIECGLQHTRKG